MVIPLNRLPIFIKKERIDVVDVLHSFFLNNLVSDEGLSPIEYLKKNSILLKHIKQCMVQFSTYFMTGYVTHTDTRTNEETEEMQIIAAMIVEKNVIMTNNKERALLHYICVPEGFRRQNVATALMTTVFKKNEYHKKEIMAVTTLPNRYRHDKNYEAMVSFFSSFKFEAMSRKSLQDGVNDVDKIILKGATVQLGQCNKIAKKR